MSVLVKKGTFVYPDSSNNLAITGVGFQPKAVLFWCTKQSAAGYAVNRALSFGWAVSSTQRACLALLSPDAATVSTDILGEPNDTRIVFMLAAGGSTELDMDFVSMDSDGFTVDPINVSAGKLYIVHYLAIGGTDVTNAWAGIIDVPTTASSVGYTTPGFRPDCLISLAYAQSLALGTYNGWKFNLGFSDGTTQALAYVHQNNVIPTDVRSLQKTGEWVHTLNFGGTDNSVGALTSHDTNGFTVNWTAVPGSIRKVAVLALKGGQYKVVTETQKTSTGTKAKTGVGFTPKGLLLAGTNRASSASVDATLASLSIGASDGATEGGTWGGSTDNVSTTDENSATYTDKIIRHATNPSTTDAEADLNSFDSDGFTLNWSTADAVAREFLALAIGNAATAQKLAPSADSADGTWTDNAAGTALAAAIDELTASDTDYIQSVVAPSNAGCRVKLASGIDPASSTGHIIHWRVQKSGTGTLDMTVVLKQGGANTLGAGTTIASFTRNGIANGFTTFDETLSGAQADAITNYADLYLEFYATGT